MNDALTFGGWIKEQRKTLDLTQEALARRVGCALETIQKIESGKRRPSKQMAEVLAECLRIAPADQPQFLQFARLPQAPFPAAGADAGPRSNLPSQITRFIGRDGEVVAASALLRRQAVRLLTLTGSPGVGKTRLSVQVATELLRHFADGVCFVALAPVTDPALVASAISTTLEVRPAGDQTTVAALLQFLRNKRMLLVLDNFEQVL